jgi:uncharacterized membrane protein YbaN (DUF454 family)
MPEIDYSHEVKLVRYPLVRFVLIGLSWILVGLGFIGIFLPILPTTPFILLAAFLYSKSSIKFYNWVMNHGLFGPPLRRWKETRSVSRRAKVLAVGTMVLTFVPTIVFWVPLVAVKAFLAFVGVSVSVFIVTRNEDDARNIEVDK